MTDPPSSFDASFSAFARKKFNKTSLLMPLPRLLSGMSSSLIMLVWKSDSHFSGRYYGIERFREAWIHFAKLLYCRCSNLSNFLLNILLHLNQLRLHRLNSLLNCSLQRILRFRVLICAWSIGFKKSESWQILLESRPNLSCPLLV